MKKTILLLVSLAVCHWQMTEAQISVSSAADLAALATQSADGEEFAGRVIEMTQDIDLGGESWTPIGTTAHPFRGEFRGNGHTIQGLHRLSGSDGVGLFGHVAPEAKIKQVGIHSSTIVAKTARRIGAIAGVCEGAISECWSMAQVVAAGNVVGGLVGELMPTGTITDCYHAGLIRNADDTIGCLVGRNAGSLNRVYNTGYAINGKAITGDDVTGSSYHSCYYDRKMYYMKSGAAENAQIIPLDETEQLFDRFKGNANWSSSDLRYPILTAFIHSDAALLSAAPVYIDTDSTEPVNHANDLTEDFHLSTADEVTWTCMDARGAQWIQIDETEVHVVRPCTETEVLVAASLHSIQRVVYFRLRRLEDFRAGLFTNQPDEKPATFCFEDQEENRPSIGSVVSATDASKGWENAGSTYFYRVDRFIIDGDTTFDQTLIEGNETEYGQWMKDYKLNTDEPGLYLLRRWAHDEGCQTEWMASRGEYVYRVFPQFEPGEIIEKTDTVYLPEDAFDHPYLLSIASIANASGGGGPIAYTWKTNGQSIAESNAAALSNYPVTAKGTYTFVRIAADSAQCAEEDGQAKGTYTLVAFDPFNPGQITEPNLHISFCSVEQAEDYELMGTKAQGGSGRYSYQWYLAMPTDTTAIAGATDITLPLSLLHPEANRSYTVVRKAQDDTRFTTMTLSEKQVSIHIVKGLTPGAIFDGELPKACIAADAGGSTRITVQIAETEAPDGDLEPDQLLYQWIRNPGNTVVAFTRELDYYFYPEDLTQGVTYSYTRWVANPGCDYTQSDGVATQYFDRGTLEYVDVTVCESELTSESGYTLTWIDGSSHTFTTDGETWRVSDTRGEQCQADTVFVINATTPPSFTLMGASYNPYEGSLSIDFEQKNENANVFHISYSPDLARFIGRNDTIGWITTPGMVLIHNVLNIGTGDCYLTIRIGETESLENGICFSEAQKTNLDICLGGYVHSKFGRVLFVDNNPENILDNLADKLEFKAYQWYKNGVKLEGETRQSYHENGRELDGVYYVILTDTKGNEYRSCEETLHPGNSSNAPRYSAVYPIPVCAGEPLTIEGFGSAIIRSMTGEIIDFLDEIEQKAQITAPRMSGIYYVQVTSPDGKTDTHKIIVK